MNFFGSLENIGYYVRATYTSIDPKDNVNLNIISSRMILVFVKRSILENVLVPIQ